MSPLTPFRYQLQADGSLIISPLRPEDAGIYSCGSHRPGHEPQKIQLRVTGFCPTPFIPTSQGLTKQSWDRRRERRRGWAGATHPRKPQVLPWVTSSWDETTPLSSFLSVFAGLVSPFPLPSQSSYLLLLASQQGVTWQCCLRSSRGISLRPGIQTLVTVLGTVE